MTTTNDLAAIERMLKNGQTVPSSMIRSLVASCKTLMIIASEQGKKIKELESKIAETEAKKAEV